MDFVKSVEDVLQKVVEAIVDYPGDVRVLNNTSDGLVVFSVKCNNKDRGKVIGKEGRMAISLRNIVNSMSAKWKMKALLEIEK